MLKKVVKHFFGYGIFAFSFAVLFVILGYRNPDGVMKFGLLFGLAVGVLAGVGTILEFGFIRFMTWKDNRLINKTKTN